MDSYENWEAPTIEQNKRCLVHNLLIHSYGKKTLRLFCTLCVQQQGTNEELCLFPNVIKHIKKRINEAIDMNKLRKMQLSSVMSHLIDSQSLNRKLVESKLAEHIQKLQIGLRNYETEVRTNLKFAYEKQEA